MLHALHLLIVTLYIIAPIVALTIAWTRTRAHDLRPMTRFFFTTFVGTLLGTTGAIIYALTVGAHADVWQIFLSIYFATSLLLILRGLDFLIHHGLRLLLLRSSPPRGYAIILLNALRVVALLGIGLPYVISAVLIYRPKVLPRGQGPIGLSDTPIQFESSDHITLRGRWMPASTRSTKTILFCHGLGAGASTQFALAHNFTQLGYNALLFDFRAHGQSGGHLTSFGDLERRDVLAAVHWLHQTHPQQSRRLVGIGASTGAAALIAAAVDPGPDGQSIQALAVYDTFDDLTLLTDDVARGSFLPPMNWLTPRISLPLASLQVGANLEKFKPALLVRDLWPRPILIIHGMRDTLIPFNRGEQLFQAAFFPKAHLWLPGDNYDQAINDADAADAVREFFDTAHPMPVI